MKPRLSSYFLSLAGAVLCQSCTVGVNYQPPQVGVPDAWAQSVSGDIRKGNSSLERWWEGFNDSALNELIDRTRDANPDLKLASQRIAEARALRGIAGSQLFPAANAGGDYARTRASESIFVPPPTNPSNLYTAGFDAGWEIDVFGGIRRNIESADALIESSVESYRDILVTLFAETALNYIEYRTLQVRINVADANIAAQARTLKLTQDRLDLGLVPKIDVTQATTNLETSRSLIPLLKTQLAFAKNRLAALTGNYPGSLDKWLARARPIPVPRKGFSAGLPADLLRARPDVRQAERDLAAQTAQIGVAESDLYPRFALFGNFALQSVKSSDFIDASSRTYSLGPSFSWQIFSAGRIRSAINAEEARTEQALSNYEGTILRAVEEVESGMAAVANSRDRIEILGRAVAASSETVTLVLSNYEGGLVDFQRVLDAERTKFTTEDEEAVTRGQIAKDYVVLYKALGGGSEVEVVPIPEPKYQPGLFKKKSPEAHASPEEGAPAE